MNFILVVVIAICTYLSRAASLVLFATPSERVQRILNRVPAALFAGLASLSLVGEQGGFAPTPIVAAMAGALMLSPTRSLLKILAGGFLGWAAVQWLLPMLANLAI